MMRILRAQLFSAVILCVGAPPPEVRSQEICRADQDNGVVRAAVRRDAAPFSFAENARGGGVAYSGYHVDLCVEFLQRHNLEYCFMEVSAESRFQSLRDLEHPSAPAADMLCGATTASISVKNEFSSSLYTFLSATGFLRRNSFVPGDFVRVGVLSNTTSSEIQRLSSVSRVALQNLFGVNTQFIETGFSSHDEVIDEVFAVEDRNVGIDIYLADKPILQHIRSRLRRPQDFTISRENISVQPYAVVFPKRQREIPGSRNINLSLEFDRFLRDEKFSVEKRDNFVADLIDRFPGLVDVSFLRLIEIQSSIPVGRVR